MTPEVLVGMINAWGDGGYDLFKNHFTDNGSNMGSKNGDVELSGKAQIFGGDPDRAHELIAPTTEVLLIDTAEKRRVTRAGGDVEVDPMLGAA